MSQALKRGMNSYAQILENGHENHFCHWFQADGPKTRDDFGKVESDSENLHSHVRPEGGRRIAGALGLSSNQIFWSRVFGGLQDFREC